jgi:ribosomal protein S20
MAWVTHLPEKCKVKLECKRQECKKKDNQKNDMKRGALAHAMRAVLTNIKEEDEDALSE